ncbi:hypothetical protein SAICODRAFT_28803 [Saitoella complicata NRRL Y-17804]|uniref:uncharacterized protein n=1 Tax=Saitoella complicata (strain BCRC 22490 / CBS 7301 / JCM 7358 / NBRC 10748 / NRRL Y-17804) TaxID=698492 RepID=UPI000867D2AC|nr:uncharacterized protein SAICODRAFT_28803 [Saitoella complicata NRRL Y-17804]ODQ55760.1 hypothetical protein SAICODRAFT_28803 [Saitoella complicata NRRL Y-17804]
MIFRKRAEEVKRIKAAIEEHEREEEERERLEQEEKERAEREWVEMCMDQVDGYRSQGVKIKN